MKRRCSDRRLARLVSQALYALEDPAAGFVFDDFDRRYCEAERKREADAARWFYRDKTSFETKYEADCAKDGEEPAWVSDCGRGGTAICRDTDLDLQEALHERRRRAALAKARRASPALAKTLRLIMRHGANRTASIGTLARMRNDVAPKARDWHRAEVLYYRHRAALLALFCD